MMSISESIDLQLATALEYSEAMYWSKYYQSKCQLKCYGSVIAGAFAGALPELNILAMNRVVGLGMEVPVRPIDIDSIIRFFNKSGSERFFVQVSPLAEQENLREMLREKGFQFHNNWTKLLRPAGRPLADVETNLNIEKIGPDQSMIYGKIIFESFDWEDERLIEWIAQSVGKPGYHHYLVKDGSLAVAAGALHVVNSFASMAFAGTLPEYRGLGAQSLLLNTRILEAREMGCNYIISETAEDTPERPVASFRNMQRFGFETAYLRQNWIYEF